MTLLNIGGRYEIICRADKAFYPKLSLAINPSGVYSSLKPVRHLRPNTLQKAPTSTCKKTPPSAFCAPAIGPKQTLMAKDNIDPVRAPGMFNKPTPVRFLSKRTQKKIFEFSCIFGFAVAADAQPGAAARVQVVVIEAIAFHFLALRPSQGRVGLAGGAGDRLRGHRGALPRRLRAAGVAQPTAGAKPAA